MGSKKPVEAVSRSVANRSGGKTASKHPVIRDEIRRRICRGGMENRLPGVRQLAREFGVHGLTVRKALWALEEEGLVKAFPGRGHFVVRNGIRFVTMLVQSSTLKSGFYGKVVSLLTEKMPDYHFSHEVRLLGSASSGEAYPEPAELGLQKGAAVLSVGIQDRAYILELMDAGFRVVTLDYVATDRWISSVGVDGLALGAEGTRYLIESGRNDILFVGHRRGRRMDVDAMLSETGYRMAMDEAGLTPRSTFATGADPHSGREAFEGALNSGSVPDAVFSASMRVTEGIRDWCEERNIRVPQDTFIMSTGRKYPDLPSIGVDLGLLCEAALKLLKEMSADPAGYTPRHVLVRAEIREAEVKDGMGV